MTSEHVSASLPPRKDASRNVLVCATGSVASVRTGAVCSALLSLPSIGNVALVYTSAGRRFTPDPPLPSTVPVYDDEADWAAWSSLGDDVLHIELRRWADALVFAPLSANSLAKLANGLCDNLATCVARAWPLQEKPFVVCPAMNTAMWNHPLTETHLDVLRSPSFGVVVVPPVEKTLACGDTGVGAMASPKTIATCVADLL